MDWQIYLQIKDGSDWTNLNSGWTNLESGISSGTMKLDNSLVEGDLSFGAMYASKFECQLFFLGNETQITISDDLSGKLVRVIRREASDDPQITSVEEEIFTGMIESSTTDYGGYDRDLVAYDAFYYTRNINLADWWNSYWAENTSITVKNLRETACTQVGLSFESQTLTNDDVVLGKEEIQDYTVITFEDIMHACGEITATFPHIDGSGTVYWAELDLSGTATSLTNEEIQASNCTYEDFVTDTIDCVALQNSSNNIYYEVGNTQNNRYSLIGNFLIIEKSEAEGTPILQAILSKIGGISYNPCEIKMIETDWSISLGGKITTPHGTAYAMAMSYSDVQMIDQVIKAPASAQNLEQAGVNYNNSLNTERRWSKIEQDIEHVRIEVGEKVDEETMEAYIELKADEIISEVVSQFDDIQVGSENLIRNSEDWNYPDYYFIGQAIYDTEERVYFSTGEALAYRIGGYQANNLDSITVSFDSGEHTVTDQDTLESIKEYFTVTANYDDGTSAEVHFFTISGDLVAGSSEITVRYGGFESIGLITVTHAA